jgi:hypothetical protein
MIIAMLSLDTLATILKAVTPLLVAAILYSQRRLFTRPQARLKTDLETLQLLAGGDLEFARERLMSSIRLQVNRIYGPPGTEHHSVPLAVFGAICSIIFWSLTWSLFGDAKLRYSFWPLLTGFMTLAGAGWIALGIEKRPPVKTLSSAELEADGGLTILINDRRKISVPLSRYSKSGRSSPKASGKVDFSNKKEYVLYWEGVSGRISLEWLLTGYCFLMSCRPRAN